MGSGIRNGVLAALGITLLAYGSSFAWMNRASNSTTDLANSSAQSSAKRTIVEQTHTKNILDLAGNKSVLEVRGMGIVVGDLADEEIWNAINERANNHATYFSRNAEDYPDNYDRRLLELGVSTGLSFKEGARHAVDQWPLPVIVWEPPKPKESSSRAAIFLAGARQKAGLGVSLLLWEDDANTNDGTAMIEKAFAFFDSHPDVPAALLFTRDGSTLRSLLSANVSAMRAGHVVPALPDSGGAILLSRSDRVDKLIRPFAVNQPANTDKNNTEHDIVKLWNFFWSKNDARGPDSFNAWFENEEKSAGVKDIVPIGIMSSKWWQAQLPEFWRSIANAGPGNFKPSPYIPVRWTTWQLNQFDRAPILGYLHRPIDIKLTDDHGEPLKTALQAEALKAGWEQAVATLPDDKEPKRVFYDTTGDKHWVIPLNQALSSIGPSAPSPDEVNEGYDIGARMGNTGVTSPLVQIGLGLIYSYKDGGASATVNRRPNGTATILMVSPPDAATKAIWEKKHNGVSPFK